MHAITQAAFQPYVAVLVPPSGALRETEDSVRGDLERGGGAIAWSGSSAVGCLRFEVEDEHLHVRRVAVLPQWQRQGIGSALMTWSHDHARALA